MPTPWDDCKVAFTYNGDGEYLWVRVQRGDIKFPTGWQMHETDSSGARLVVVFRVDGVPQVRDGERVVALLTLAASTDAQEDDE